jgi:hypothetical protein
MKTYLRCLEDILYAIRILLYAAFYREETSAQ